VDPIAGEARDHLVRVHVRRGAGAGLEDVDRELVVVLSLRDGVARARDPLGELGVQVAELRIDASRGGLDAAQPVDDRSGDRMPGDLEVLDRLARLAPPELGRRLLHRSPHRPVA
jgi:hypothetical protein